MNFFLHIGSGKTVSSEGLIGIFNVKSIQDSRENRKEFWEFFDEDENERFIGSRSLLLFSDGYIAASKIKTETLVDRRKRLKNAMQLNPKKKAVSL